MIRLRPHHLLCILTYRGTGYSEDFTRNFDDVVRRLNEGTGIQLVDGPDDICAGLRGEDRHCERASVKDRDDAAILALEQILGAEGGEGGLPSLSGTLVQRMRSAFPETRRDACVGCEWFDLCTSVANSDFAETKLHRG